MMMSQSSDYVISADIRKVKLIYDTSSMLRGRMVIRDNTYGDTGDDDIVSADASEFGEAGDVMGADNEIGYLTTSYFRGITPWTVILPLLAFVVYNIPSMLRTWGTGAPTVVQNYLRKWDNGELSFRGMLRSKEKQNQVNILRERVNTMKADKKQQLKLLEAAKIVKSEIPEASADSEQQKKRNAAIATVERLTNELKTLHDAEMELFAATHSDWQTKLVKSFEEKFTENTLLSKTIRGLYAVAKTGGQYAAYLAGLSLLVYAIYPVFRIHRPDQTISWQAMYNKKKGSYTIRQTDDTGEDASMARFVLEMDTESLEWLLISDSNQKFNSREADIKLDKNMKDVTSTLSDWKPDVTTTSSSDDSGVTTDSFSEMSSEDRRRNALLVFPRQFTGGEMYEVVNTVDTDHGMSYNDVTVSMPTDKTLGVPLEFFKGRISFGETYEINLAQKVTIPADVITLAMYTVRGMYVMPIGVILFLAVLLGGSMMVYYLIKNLAKRFGKTETPEEKKKAEQDLADLKSIRDSGSYTVTAPITMEGDGGGGGGAGGAGTLAANSTGTTAFGNLKQKFEQIAEDEKKRVKLERKNKRRVDAELKKEAEKQLNSSRKRLDELQEERAVLDKKLKRANSNVLDNLTGGEQQKIIMDLIHASFDLESKKLAVESEREKLKEMEKKKTGSIQESKTLTENVGKITQEIVKVKEQIDKLDDEEDTIEDLERKENQSAGEKARVTDYRERLQELKETQEETEKEKRKLDKELAKVNENQVTYNRETTKAKTKLKEAIKAVSESEKQSIDAKKAYSNLVDKGAFNQEKQRDLELLLDADTQVLKNGASINRVEKRIADIEKKLEQPYDLMDDDEFGHETDDDELGDDDSRDGMVRRPVGQIRSMSYRATEPVKELGKLL